MDKREISFDARALISVIKASLGRVAAIDLPGLEPTGVLFDAVNQKVVFTYANEPPEVSVAGQHLGAWLVSYCIKARIPLPLRADKIVHVEADEIVIVCTTRYNEAPQPWG